MISAKSRDSRNQERYTVYKRNTGYAFRKIKIIKMQDYKIIQTELWYSIYKQRSDGDVITILYYSINGRWTMNKTFTKTFVNKDSALSALMIIRRRDKIDDKPDDKIEEEERWPKLSWGDCE